MSRVGGLGLFLLLLATQQSWLACHALQIQTCHADCESTPMHGKLSCDGRQLRCVPDPCCTTDTLQLSLAENQITHLKILAFQSFPRLKILDLRQNAIAGIASGAFGNLGKLQVLDLRINRMRHLYAGMFTGLTGLQKLYLANNEIESIAIGTFTGMSQLLSLKLNFNSLTMLQNSVFLPLHSLQRLYLYGNNLSTIQDRAFRGLTNIRTISLADNPLQAFPDFLLYLPALTHLRLRNAPISCDCRMEFLRTWLRENMYDAYESYATCQSPPDLQGILVYRLQTPLPCGLESDNLPVSREVDLPSDRRSESAIPRHFSPSNAPYDSESEYSEFWETASHRPYRPNPKTNFVPDEGEVSRGSPGRPPPGNPSTTSSGKTHLGPVRPTDTVTGSPDREHITSSRTGDTWYVNSPGTFSPVTHPTNREIPNGRITESPKHPAVSVSNTRPGTGFVDIPRQSPEQGSKSDADWPETDVDRSHHDHQGGSSLTTISPKTTGAVKTSTVMRAPRGPPQTWGFVGSSVVINCPIRIRNGTVSKIKWLTPHGKLVMSNSSRYAIAKKGALVVHYLQEYDHGTYRCIVRSAMNSVKILPARLILACPCHEKEPHQPSFEASIENTTSNPEVEPGSHPHETPPQYDSGCSSVPMVVAIVTTFQATVALCVITFCLCCSKNINASIKERACTGVPEPIAVVDASGKRSRPFARSSEPTSMATFSTRGSESYEALTDRFAPGQSSSVRSFDSFYESAPMSEYVNYRKPKHYMYMVGYMDTRNGRRAIGYRSSSESQCASVREVSNENIYVTKD